MKGHKQVNTIEYVIFFLPYLNNFFFTKHFPLVFTANYNTICWKYSIISIHCIDK